MQKIYATKPKPLLAPQPRSLRRFIHQMIANILKRQPQKSEGNSQGEVIQQLKKLERKIEAVERAVAKQAKRGR